MKIFTGKVVAIKSAKTAKVEVTRIVTHPIYKKKIKKSRTFLVHDEIGVTIGDQINFVASKPHSKLKKWEVYIEGDKK